MPNRTGFQSFVNNELPKGVAGDFASTNPRANPVGGPGQYVAPAEGTTVGVFAWFDPTTGVASNYYKPNSFLAFVHRQNNALITTFLGIASLVIPQGNIVADGFTQGDFYGIFQAGASVGQKVYANPKTGALTANATGNGVAGSNTGASVSGSVLTTTDADASGSATAVGQVITGGTLPEGTYIASSAGTGSGTHLWNLANLNGTAIPDNAGPFTSVNTGVVETNFTVADTVDPDAVGTGSSIAATGVLTIGALSSGTFIAGQFISDTNNAQIPVSANAQILYQISGTVGGAGTYQTNYNAVVTSTTITGTEGKIGSITSWGL